MNKIKLFLKNISPLNNKTEMPAVIYAIKVIIIFWVVKFASELIGEGIVMGILFANGKNPLQGEMFEPDIMMLIMYYGYAIFIGIMILYWKLFQKKNVAELGFTKKADTYFIGVIIGAILVTVSALLIMLTGTLIFNGLFERIDLVYILLMLGGFIFQGAMEEVLCRGIVFQLLKDKISIPFAIGISTVLFIVPHIGNMGETSTDILSFTIINLILISLVFSFLTLHYKNIWAASGFHSIWNFILYNILGLNLSGNDRKTVAVFDMRSVGDNILNGGSYGLEASVITAVVLVVTLIVMSAIFNRKGGTTDGIQ